jgi:hypothetical protein
MIALKLVLITAAWGSFLAALAPDLAYDLLLAVVTCFVV